MINENEKKILELLNKRHLMTKGEITTTLNGESMDGVEVTMGRLRDRGLIENVQNLGNCIVITKKGIQAINGS